MSLILLKNRTLKPAHIFNSGQQGFWFDALTPGVLFQESAGTTLVDAADQPVGLWLDRSGNTNKASQSTAAARPTSRLSPSRIFVDRVDDRLLITVPTGGFVGTLVLATTEGTAAYGVNIPAGTWALGSNTTTGTIYFPGTTVVGAICRHGAMTDSEVARCIAYLRSIGGGPVGYAGSTNVSTYWRGSTWITEISSLVNTTNITNFYAAWLFNTGITSFPGIPDTSNVTNFGNAWSTTSSLVTFPPNQFDNCPCTNFTYAFTLSALSQTSVDNILVSIATGSVARNTTNGTLHINGGTSATPSATGKAAADTLRARGWTVTLNGY